MTKKEIIVGICTPYLTQDCAESSYSPGQTDEHIITLRHMGYSLSIASSLDLAIVGSTIDGESFVRSLRGSGLIVGRYSKFFGGITSPYTGLGTTAEQAGYSLDIPKSPEKVRELLSHDGFLEGILARDEKIIKESIHQIGGANSNWSTRVTPYLSEALQYRGRAIAPQETYRERVERQAADKFFGPIRRFFTGK